MVVGVLAQALVPCENLRRSRDQSLQVRVSFRLGREERPPHGRHSHQALQRDVTDRRRAVPVHVEHQLHRGGPSMSERQLDGTWIVPMSSVDSSRLVPTKSYERQAKTSDAACSFSRAAGLRSLELLQRLQRNPEDLQERVVPERYRDLPLRDQRRARALLIHLRDQLVEDL